MTSCSAPKRAAYVNVNQVVASELRTEVQTPLPGSVQIPVLSLGGASIPEEPRLELEGTDASARLMEARKEIQAHRDKSLKLLEHQLFESMLRDIDRFRLSENAEIESKLRESLGSATEKIGIALQEYANARWPIANRLALLVGYPFPSLSSIPNSGDTNIDRKRRNEIVSLYDALEKLERKYSSDVQTILGEFFGSAAQARLSLGLSVVSKIDEAEQSARRQATRTISSVNDLVLVKLLDTANINLPAVPGVVGAVKEPPENLGRTSALQPTPAIITVRQEIEADLAIWLGTHARFLIPEAGKAPDETENFIKWRSQLHHGR